MPLATASVTHCSAPHTKTQGHLTRDCCCTDLNPVQTTRRTTQPHAGSLPYLTLHCTALHCTALHCTALHYTTLHYTTLHYTTLHYVTLRYVTLRCVALRCVALRYVTLRYVALRCVTLRYVTLRYVSFRYITLQLFTYHPHVDHVSLTSRLIGFFVAFFPCFPSGHVW